MAQFKFRLAPLLRIRDAERQQRRAELAEAYRAEEILRTQRENLLVEMNAVKQRARTAVAPGEVNIDRLLDAHRYGLLLQARSQQLVQQGERVHAEIERRRKALVEADRQVRVIEKLRDRQQAAFQQQAFRLETKEMDEVAIRLAREEAL